MLRSLGLALTASLLLTAGIPADKVGQPIWQPSDGSNAPMGTGKGIFPGRVVWDRNLKATPWDGKTGHWWDEGTGIDLPTVRTMFSESLQATAGQKEDTKAWDALFKHFNKTHGRGDHGYRKGEKIAIKINVNNAYEGYSDADQQIDASPQTVQALLEQLVNGHGVSQELITVYEATRVVPDRIFNPSHKAFPKVKFADSQGDPATNGRYPVEYVKNAQHYSVEKSFVGMDLPTFVVEATYLINMSLVKGHPTTGFTLTAKNHYGTINVRDHEMFVNSHAHPMGIYHPFVDMIGSKQLGQKTLIFIADGLYGIRDVNDPVGPYARWQTMFRGEYLASLFMSQDPLAIDSVGLDFIRTEWPWCRDTFQAIKNSDNYLHEAALADHPPSGTYYAPDGKPLKSLGVHEHWNNPVDRQYSRNLGRKQGIELYSIQHEEQ